MRKEVTSRILERGTTRRPYFTIPKQNKGKKTKAITDHHKTIIINTLLLLV